MRQSESQENVLRVCLCRTHTETTNDKEKTERERRTGHIERTEHSETSGRTDRRERTDHNATSERTDHAATSGRTDRRERPERNATSERTDHRERSAYRQKTDDRGRIEDTGGTHDKPKARTDEIRRSDDKTKGRIDDSRSELNASGTTGKSGGSDDKSKERTDENTVETDGFTSQDISLATEGWKNMNENRVENGMTVLMAFFERHNQYQQLFPFRDVPLAELRQNERFKNHVNRGIMFGLEVMVDNMNNPSTLRELMFRQGVTHGYRKVEEDAFWKLKAVMMEVFHQWMSKEAVQAWSRLLDVGLSILAEGVRTVKKK